MTLKSTASKICLALLLSGCSQYQLPRIEVDSSPRFCDIEEARYFTADEVAWRAENAPDNLKKDLKTNKAGETFCEWKKPKPSSSSN